VSSNVLFIITDLKENFTIDLTLTSAKSKGHLSIEGLKVNVSDSNNLEPAGGQIGCETFLVV
jgi:hypothetical protein